MTQARFVLIGDQSLTAQCAQILLDRGHHVVLLVSGNSDIRDWAASHNVAAADWDNLLIGQLRTLQFDWLLSVANLRLLSTEMLSLPVRGAINFHDGLLPDFAGLNTPSWSLMANRPIHGVTWHFISGGVDDGDIVKQRSFEVAHDETVLTLNAKCFEAGLASFGDVVDAIEAGAVEGVPQDFSSRQYFSRSKRPDALATLDFHRPAEDLSRLVRSLSFGDGYSNPLVSPKVAMAAGTLIIKELEVLDGPAGAAPGALLAKDGNILTIAAGDRQVRITVLPDAVLSALNVGDHLGLDDQARASLTEICAPLVASEARHLTRLKGATDLDLSLLTETEQLGATDKHVIDLTGVEIRASVIVAFLARLSAQADFSLAYANDTMVNLTASYPGYFSSYSVLNVALPADVSDRSALQLLDAQLATLRQDGPFLADIFHRTPALTRPRLLLGLRESALDAAAIAGCAATFTLHPTGRTTLTYNSAQLAAGDARRLAGWLATFAAAVAAGRDAPLKLVPILSAQELHEALYARNETAAPFDRTACVHQLIELQCAATPDATAVVHGRRSITYRELNVAADTLAATLKARGVGPDTLVGLHLPRSIEMVIGVLGIHKAGGAYVPLDPDFPAERIAYMVGDSDALAIVTNGDLAANLDAGSDRTILIEDVLAGPNNAKQATDVQPHNLAYVIYTSGSTGRPKGVMVEHGNVVNFFAGMDLRIPVDPNGDNVWLAVTSLSFDISVLELCWTLTRGFKVVLHDRHDAKPLAPERPKLLRQVEFGLFYWGNDDGVGQAKYELLLEGAKIADRNGFTSIWTPERHFGAFGGPYPNPAVTGAAVAAVTKNLAIRAGSCVLPLHHAARVAEEWAVIDNISNGRVGLAFASGWMPEDFVLRPENGPPNNKTALVRDIDIVRRLWRGESVAFAMGSTEVNVITQPRPIQKELPIWITSAGNPETFREAARQGANVLTHLLGQSVDELADKLRIYRQTLVEHGRNPADYKVTLMLHTLIGADREVVREMARQPMKEYLRSSAALIKQYAWAFPAFKKPANAQQAMDIDLRSLDDDEMEAILEFAFLRYFEDSGLFGTLEDGYARIAQVAAIGVDEIACLIDYGIPTKLVLDSLVPLSDLVRQVRTGSVEQGVEGVVGLAGEIGEHMVTHLQCTPSMATMFLSSDEDRKALGAVRHLFIGGEALHGTLVKALKSATSATLDNMYGPTETTIWSSTMAVSATDGVVPIGTPIANTQLYVLDPNQQPVPAGMAGELYIAGDGVTRGYYRREELTAQRYFPNPFTVGRMYRTGDLVSVHPQNGNIQFLGRTDFQVKIRGYRIELGEIETAIGSFDSIGETVVMARRDDATDVRLVAYMRLTSGSLDEAALRQHLSKRLPVYMVPAHFVVLDTFPLTPNMKVDRNRLPAPKAKYEVLAEQIVMPENDAQRSIAEAFQRTLGLNRVGLNDNFFTLGGHSLLAVQMHRDLKASIAPDLAITDIFRYPTVAALALRVSNAGTPDLRLTGAAQRAAARRNAMAGRNR